MKNRIKEIDSIKYRLKIANHQWKTQILTDDEYNKILLSLEKEIRGLEDEIFNDREVIE